MTEEAQTDSSSRSLLNLGLNQNGNLRLITAVSDGTVSKGEERKQH